MQIQIFVAFESVKKNAKTRPILWGLVDSVDAPNDHVQMMRFVEK